MSQPATTVGARAQARPRDRSNLVAALVIGVIGVGLGVIAGIANPLLNRSTATEGALVDSLFGLMFGIATTIFAIVQGALIYSVVKFRRRPGDDSDGPPIHGHVGLEVLWSAIPAALVTGVAIYSYAVLTQMEQVSPEAMVVEVTARQFSWEFYYPATGVRSSELHVPLGRQTLLRMRSADVLHAFWVPEFRVKKDILPDRVTEMVFTADRLGRYPIVCAELCGAAHAVMRSEVVVQEQADFEAWWTQALAQAGADTSDPIAYGRVLFTRFACDACHRLDDAEAAGTIGPDLNGVGAVAGERVVGQAADEHLRAAIVEPNAHIVEGYSPNVMPQDYGQRMSDEELAVLVHYLAAQR
jgi:cytochrome c oxidase subunit 2